MHYGCTQCDHTDSGYSGTYEAPAARRIQRYHLTLAILVLRPSTLTLAILVLRPSTYEAPAARRIQRCHLLT